MCQLLCHKSEAILVVRTLSCSFGEMCNSLHVEAIPSDAVVLPADEESWDLRQKSG